MPDTHDRDDKMIRVVTLENLESFKKKYDVQINNSINMSIDKYDCHIKNLFIIFGLLYIIMNVAFGYMIDQQNTHIRHLETQINILESRLEYANENESTETAVSSAEDAEQEGEIHESEIS